MNNSLFNINNSYNDSFTFQVNNSNLSTFVGIIKKNTNQNVRYVMNSESAEAGNIPSYTMIGASPYTIEIQTDKLENIDRFDFQAKSNNVIYGHLNLTKLSGLTYLDVSTSYSLSSVTFPHSDAIWTKLDLGSSALKNLNLSTLDNLGGEISFYGCPYLTGITFPNSTQTTSLALTVCNLLTNLDFSPMSGIANSIISINSNEVLSAITFPYTTETPAKLQLSSNNSITSYDLTNFVNIGNEIDLSKCTTLTGVTFPNSTTEITNFEIQSSDSLKTLDLSNLTGLGGIIELYSNPALTALTLPNSSTSITNFKCYSTGLYDLDLSTTTGLGGTFYGQSNDNLTAITFPNISLAVKELPNPVI